ncbi:MAG: orotidine 5'-phosphate decarboxylase [Erysipelotrichaceae bacterium]|jgi:3-hexulose-6-phosphate synthase|nr:orotidine 5'-phosphate decarboxylase [Erysipelotrichaceae bacterium]
MKLQLALDTQSLEESLALVAKVQDCVDIIEIGTPFILKEGNRPVTAMKKAFPQLLVLADTKIMDGGAFEASAAFAAGADLVTVCAVAYDATILGVIEAAKKAGKQVLVDMIATKDIVNRAKEIDAMGADYLCCHTAFDIQSTGASPLAELKLLNKAIKNGKSAVAGGVKLATIDEIVEEGTQIVVVGGAIANAPDPAAMARAIKERMR